MLGTKYPYLDISNPGRVRSTLLSLKRIIAPINPFAKSQVPLKDRAHFGIYNKAGYYKEEPLPNPVSFTKIYPLHYDPNTQHFTEPKTFVKNENTADYGVLAIEEKPKPRVCEVYLKKFKRCEMINGKGKCEDEGQEFMQVCPNFVLDMYREDKLKNQLHRKI